MISTKNMSIYVADYIIHKLNNINIRVSNKKLQKLLYFADASYMSKNSGSSMFPDYSFEAWPYGPVIPELYKLYSDREKFIENDKTFTLTPVNEYSEVEREISQNIKIKNVVDEIIDILGSFSVEKLIEATHINGGPWHRAYNSEENKNYKFNINNMIFSVIEIEKEEIYNFYKFKTVEQYVNY